MILLFLDFLQIVLNKVLELMLIVLVLVIQLQLEQEDAHVIKLLLIGGKMLLELVHVLRQTTDGLIPQLTNVNVLQNLLMQMLMEFAFLTLDIQEKTYLLTLNGIGQFVELDTIEPQLLLLMLDTLALLVVELINKWEEHLLEEELRHAIVLVDT